MTVSPTIRHHLTKTSRIAAITVASTMGLLLLITLLLYLPPVQNWAVRLVTAYASDKTGMDIHIDHVELAFPLDLEVRGIRVIQPCDTLPSRRDTIAHIQRVVADVQMLPLLRGVVNIDGLELRQVALNTANIVHQARVRGTVGLLSVRTHGIDLGRSDMTINSARLSDARLNIELSDTVPPDTSKTPNYWKIKVAALAIDRSAVTLHTPGDTLAIQAYLGRVRARQGYFDLYTQLYRVAQLDWQQGRLCYDNHMAPHTGGLDYNHLALSHLSLGVDSLFFHAPRIEATVRSCSFTERCGLRLTSLQTRIAIDSAAISLPMLALTTTESAIRAQAHMALNVLDSLHPGTMTLTLHTSIGKQDIAAIGGRMLPAGLLGKLPNYPLRIDGVLRGNLRRAHLTGLHISMPTAADLHADGFVGNLTLPDKLTADLNIDLRTYQIGFIKNLLPRSIARQMALPYGMRLRSHLTAHGPQYAATLALTEGRGSLQGRARIDTRRMAYSAQLRARGLQVAHFVPHMGIGTLTADIEAQGTGTDPLKTSTRLTARARVAQLTIGRKQVGHTEATLTMSHGHIHLAALGHNAFMDGSVGFDGIANGRYIRGTFTCNLSRADLASMGISQKPLSVGASSRIDIETNLKDYYRVLGHVADIGVSTQERIYHPETITMDLLSTRDTTHAVVHCGDFRLDCDAQGDYTRLLRQISRLTDEIKLQAKGRYIDQLRLRRHLPQARIYLNSGRQNVFARFLKWNGYEVGRLLVDASCSPQAGLNGRLSADSVVAARFLLDTIRVTVSSDSARTLYQAQIRNNEHNPDYTFNALLSGGVFERGAYASTEVYDAANRLGLRLGLAAAMADNGIKLHLYGKEPILGYKRFDANKDNFILLADDDRISANLKLTAADGMGVQLYSDDSNAEALQDLTLSLAKFDLHKVLSVIPYMPDVEGLMNGDFHVVKTAKELSVSSAMTIDDMVYEKCRMGDLGSEFVYMPKDNGAHYVDGTLTHDGEEVGTIKGTYTSTGDGWLDATLGLERMPMQLVNGFVPDRIVGLRGYGEGQLTVRGTLAKPTVDGEVYLDSTYLVSEPYGVQMRFADDPVRIVGSRLLFENFEMFANNDAPLNIAGTLDFTDLSNMMLDVRMRATDFKIIDAKENTRSEAYGKAFVNFYGSMQGPVDALRMRGKLDVLGNTDMTYVMRDAELTTDTQLDDLVKFTNFKDTTTAVAIQRPALRGLDMDLSVSIDEGSHIMCMLNADHSNYISLIGGGDLRMRYNTTDELTLTGRYTLYDGEMKYSLPIIPLKTFSIQDGSYLEFTGDPMNPQLHITATERVKATVSEGSSGRAVDFDCGVKLTQTLSKLGLEFIIDAPNDMTVSDQLKTMATEGRSKVAVTMLASGMYLTDGNTSQFTMNSALSSFLQSEINNVAGKAMRSIGLDIGMSIDNTTTESGMHTDYNFKFSKRLWNNRLSVNIGGKVSTGADIDMRQNDNTFFDKVELEYRLGQSSSKYLRLFYDNNKYDWLEGPLGEYGAGFVWKRKLRHFRDIFRIDRRAAQPTVQNGAPPTAAPESNLEKTGTVKDNSKKKNDEK